MVLNFFFEYWLRAAADFISSAFVWNKKKVVYIRRYFFTWCNIMCELFGTAFTLSCLICLLYFWYIRETVTRKTFCSTRFIGVVCENEWILTETKRTHFCISWNTHTHAYSEWFIYVYMYVHTYGRTMGYIQFLKRSAIEYLCTRNFWTNFRETKFVFHIRLS